jgi:hypothetical protein
VNLNKRHKSPISPFTREEPESLKGHSSLTPPITGGLSPQDLFSFDSGPFLTVSEEFDLLGERMVASIGFIQISNHLRQAIYFLLA